MSAIFVKPLAFTQASTSPTPLAGSVAYVGNDHPGLVWRYGLTTPYLIIDLGLNPASYNYVALFGSNLRASDTVQIRTGTTTAGTGAYAGIPLAAYTGAKDVTTTTTSVYKLSSTRTERYVRIDLGAASHPDGWVQFSRLVIGSAISTAGIAFDAEHGFEAQSVSTTGPGYRSVDAYNSFDSWKVSTGWITDDSWRQEWAPMLRYASAGGCIMMLVDDALPTNWQTDAIYGYLSGTASGKAEAFNKWRFESKLVAFSR